MSSRASLLVCAAATAVLACIQRPPSGIRDVTKPAGIYDLTSWDSQPVPGPAGGRAWVYCNFFHFDTIVAGTAVFAGDDRVRAVDEEWTLHGKPLVGFDTSGVPRYGSDTTVDCSVHVGEWDYDTGKLSIRSAPAVGNPDPAWMDVTVSDTTFTSGTRIEFDDKTYVKR